MSSPSEGDTPQSSDEQVCNVMPPRNTRLRPVISAIRPKGMRKTEEERRYEAGTHPSNTALMENSFPIAGRAILMEELMNGVRKEARLATTSAVCLLMGLDKDGGPVIVADRVASDPVKV